MTTGMTIANDEYYYTSDDLTTKQKNPMFGKVEPVMLSHLTDATDWGPAAASDRFADMVEMGHLNGRTDPEMFVADQPSNEWMFNDDQIKYKIRHEYAGAVIDYRSGYKGIVA